MIGKELLSQKPVPIAQVKNIMKKRDPEELIYEQKIALEHAEKFSKLSASDTKKLIKDLKDVDVRVNEETITKIANILPADGTELRAVMLRSGTKLKKEQTKKILDIIAKYR